MINYEGFAKAILTKYWDGDCGDIDGMDVQDLAEEHGVIVKVPYDPEKHGEEGGSEFGIEPGDDWYVPAWKEEGK